MDRERAMSRTEPTPAQEVVTEAPSDARPYPPSDVAVRPQGPRSPGESEPRDMGAFDDEEYEEPQYESTKGNGKSGYRGA